MNKIFIHGKITIPAKSVLANINNHETVVAKFTVVDVGEPYAPSEPTFFRVNFAKASASMIEKYLVKDKEVNIFGKVQERFRKNPSGEKQEVYYVIADTVELLPVFIKHEENSHNVNG